MEGVREILLRAAEIISAPGAWCKNTSAVTKDGCRTNAHSQDAVAWCALGALYRAYLDAGLDPGSWGGFYRLALQQIGWSAYDLAALNDRSDSPEPLIRILRGA